MAFSCRYMLLIMIRYIYENALIIISVLHHLQQGWKLRYNYIADGVKRVHEYRQILCPI